MRVGKSSIVLLTLLVHGCLDRYESPPIDHTDLLVVDGFINTTQHRVDVRLSHTISVQSNQKSKPEPEATVLLATDGGKIYSLKERDAGIYELTNLEVQAHEQYQLQIETASGERFYSDFIRTKKSPAIEKLAWKPVDEGAKIYINTSDPTGQTRYYRWFIDETWEYTSPLRSDFKLVNKRPVPRNDEEGIYRCWKNSPPTKILIGTTQQLAADVVYQFPLQVLLAGSQQLGIRYSLLVRQTAITVDEYEYLLRLQNTTENLGGLFDHQPSRITGNIHNEGNLTKPVLGYFSGGSIEEKRIFIRFDDLPNRIRIPPLRGPCVQDTVCLRFQDGLGLNCSIDVQNLAGTELILGPIFEGLAVIGFLKSNEECADCRYQGGTTQQPDFW